MAKILGQSPQVEERKIDPNNVSKEDVLAMAQYIQTLEQMLKDQKGYIIQLETMIQQRNSQLRQQQQINNDINNAVEVKATLDL